MTRKDTGQTNFYTGLCEPSWKLRYTNHKQNFRSDNQQNRIVTCLSKHIWKLKDQNVDNSLKFKQLAQAKAYNPVTGMCRLCLKEFSLQKNAALIWTSSKTGTQEKSFYGN